jgi:hypothetical protein
LSRYRTSADEAVFIKFKRREVELLNATQAAERAALDQASPGDRESVERRIDASNERLLVALQRDGSSYTSNAAIGGRFALRACIMNHRTTLADMDVLLADVRRVAIAVGEL